MHVQNIQYYANELFGQSMFPESLPIIYSRFVFNYDVNEASFVSVV